MFGLQNTHKNNLTVLVGLKFAHYEMKNGEISANSSFVLQYCLKLCFDWITHLTKKLIYQMPNL